MNIKIQGGGSGRYANKGSCTAIITYLQQEDMERVMEGQQVEPFFNYEHDRISAKEVTFQIDNNKAQLGRNDAKFYALTISPSKDEIKTMGNSPEQRADAMKKYVRNVMDEYAKKFNREGLNSGNQLKYYAKIHHNRGDNLLQMHCHVIVSRKCANNKLKLSPQTNHKNTKKGMIKGGFDRTQFYQKGEELFDKQFKYERTPEQTFSYQNAMKNGGLDDIKSQIQKAVSREAQRNKEQTKSKSKNKDIEL